MFDRRLIAVLLLSAVAWLVLADSAAAACRGWRAGRFRGRACAAAARPWAAVSSVPSASGCPGGTCNSR